MDSLLTSKEVECRNLRGELSRRDSAAQRLELRVFSLDQEVRHQDDELQAAKTEIGTLESRLRDAHTELTVGVIPREIDKLCHST